MPARRGWMWFTAGKLRPLAERVPPQGGPDRRCHCGRFGRDREFPRGHAAPLRAGTGVVTARIKTPGEPMFRRRRRSPTGKVTDLIRPYHVEPAGSLPPPPATFRVVRARTHTR